MVFAGGDGGTISDANFQESRLKFIVEDQASDRIGAIEAKVSSLSTAATGFKFIAIDGILPGLKLLAGGINSVKNGLTGAVDSVKGILPGARAIGDRLGNVNDELVKIPSFVDTAAKRFLVFESILTKVNIAFLAVKAGFEVKDAVRDLTLELDGTNRALKLLDENTGAFEQLALLKNFKSPAGLLSLFGKDGESNVRRAVSAYNDFNESLSRLNTVFLQGNREGIEEFGVKIQDLVSKELKNAISSTEALAGAYEVASGGFTEAADNIAVLTAGLKLSTVAQSDQGGTLRLLVQTLKAYNLGSEKAAETAAKLNAIVQNGITTIPELNLGLGQTAGVANQAGISLDELGALIARLTTEGTSTPIALTQIQSLAKVIASGRLQQNADALNLTLGGARLELTAAAVKANGLVQTLRDLQQATQGNSKTILGLTQDFQAFKAISGVLSKDIEGFANVVSEKFGTTVAQSLQDVFNIRIDNSQTQQLVSIVNKATESIIRIGRIAAPFFQQGLQSLNRLLVKIEDFVSNNEDLIATFIRASLAFNVLKGAVATVGGVLVSLLGIFVSIRVLTGQFFKDVGSLFRVTKRLGDEASIIEKFNNRLRNNALVQAKGLSVREKLLIVIKNLTGIRAVENLQLDENNKFIKANTKSLTSQVTGVNNLSLAFANLADRVLPNFAKRYKENVSRITETPISLPDPEAPEADRSKKDAISVDFKDAERNLSGIRKSVILTTSGIQAAGDTIANTFKAALTPIAKLAMPIQNVSAFYQEQIGLVRSAEQSTLRLAAAEGRRSAAVLVDRTVQLTAADKARIAISATLEAANKKLQTSGNVLNAIYQKQLSRVKTLAAEKAFLANANRVEGQTFASLSAQQRASLIAQTQLNQQQKISAARATAGVLIGRATADTRRAIAVAYRRELRQVKLLNAAKARGIPIEKAATNAAVRRAAVSQKIGVFGLLQARIASLNVLFPTFAKSITAAGGAIGFVTGGVKALLGAFVSLSAVLLPLVAIGAVFQAFTAFQNLKADAKRLTDSLQTVSEELRTNLEIGNEIGKIETFERLEDQTLSWNNALFKALNTLDTILLNLTEPVRLAFQADNLENAARIIDLVGTSQLRTLESTQKLNKLFSESGELGEIVARGFTLTQGELENSNKFLEQELSKANNQLQKSKQNIVITQRALEDFRKEREALLAKEGNKVKEKDSFKLLETTIKNLEVRLQGASKESDVLATKIGLITEATKQRNIIQQRLNAAETDGNQSILANKLAAAVRNGNEELESTIAKLKIVRTEFAELDVKGDLEGAKNALTQIEGITDKLEKQTLSQVGNIQKQFDNNFISAKQARKELEAILNTEVDIGGGQVRQLQEFLKPEDLQTLLDQREELLTKESEGIKKLFELEATQFQILEQSKIVSSEKATEEINRLNLLSAQEDLNLLQERLNRKSITDQKRLELELEFTNKQKEIEALRFKGRVDSLNSLLNEERKFLESRVKLFEEFGRNQLTNSIANQRELENVRLQIAANAVRTLNNEFEQLKLVPNVDENELAKAQQALLAAQAKFQVLQVQTAEDRSKRAFDSFSNRRQAELVQLQLLEDESIESKQRVIAKRIQLDREVLLEEERILKERLATARRFGAETSQIELELLQKQLDIIKSTSEQIASAFQFEANRLKAIAEKFQAEAQVKITQQEALTSNLELQVRALDQRNRLSSLFEDSQIKSLESAIGLTKNRQTQINLQRELLKAQESALSRQITAERQRFEIKQREKDFELEILEIKTRAATFQRQADLAEAIANAKKIQNDRTASKEEKAAAAARINEAKELFKLTALQTEQISARRQLRANEREIERQALELSFQGRRDEIEEQRVSLTSSTRDDAKLARERARRARNTVTPKFETEDREPLSIVINGKKITSRESVSLDRRESNLREVDLPSIANKSDSKISEIENKFTSIETLVTNAQDKASLDLQKSRLEQNLSEQKDRSPLMNFDSKVKNSTDVLSSFAANVAMATEKVKEAIENIAEIGNKNAATMEQKLAARETIENKKINKKIEQVKIDAPISITINKGEGEPIEAEEIGNVVLDKLNKVADRLLSR